MADEDKVLEVLRRCGSELQLGDADHLSPEQRLVGVLDWLDFEITQGGLVTYLGNTAGRFAPEAAAALDRLGCHDPAILLREVLALFPPECGFADQEARQAVISHWDEATLRRVEHAGDRMLEAEPYFGERLHGFIVANLDRLCL